MNQRQITVREAITPQEIMSLYLVLSQLRTEFDSPEVLLNAVNRAKSTGYILHYATLSEDLESVIGVIGFRVLCDLCWGKSLYIDDLVIDQEKRGIGLGSFLVDYAIEIAKKLNCKYVRLSSGLSRSRAHAFYQKKGFTQTSFSFAFRI